MGIIDSLMNKINGKNERLLRWQNLVMSGSPNKLIMTEQQLKSVTNQQAENDLRIMKDCANLIEKTTKPDVFFMRLNLLVEKANHLVALGQYITFSGASPVAIYNEAVKGYQELTYKFLIRYFSDTFDKAEVMKTEKGRIGKYQKFYDSLQEYYRYMDTRNIDYIETKYKAYTKPRKG